MAWRGVWWVICVCVLGGSFEATQSLVLRHCIPAGWLPVPDAFLPQSHQGDCCLESGPTFSKFRARSGKGFLPSPPHTLTLQRGSHLTHQPSYSPPTLGGLEWCLAWPGWGGGGLVPDILSDLHKAVPARPSVLFPFLYMEKRNGEGVLSRRVGLGGGNSEDPWLVGKGLA